MANNETSFKKEIRETVKAIYGTRVHMWNTTDKFIQGIPDTCLTFAGTSIGWEAKFVKEPPKTMTGRMLKHPVTGPQLTFLKNNALAGGVGIIVIGSEDDALFLTTEFINNETGNLTKADMARAIAAYEYVPRVQKIRGIWRLEGILERMLRLKGQL